MLDAYEALLAARSYTADTAQRTAAERLQRLYYELLSFKVARRGALRRIFSPPVPPRGLYFWGGVGRGKSFLMDCFYAVVPYRRKRRIHFHAFMHDVHRQLNELKGERDPLLRVAERIAGDVRLICFDEFHVSDIADAMILGRLLEALFARGVIFVMTSNYPPESLYPNGLQRENFLPTIALIKSHIDVLQIDAGLTIACVRLSRWRYSIIRLMPRLNRKWPDILLRWLIRRVQQVAVSRCLGAIFRP